MLTGEPWRSLGGCMALLLVEGLVKGYQSLLQAEDRGLGTVGQVQLREDARYVCLHGLLADRQLLRDLAVGPAAGEDREHLALARGKLVERLAAGRAAHLPYQTSRDPRVEHALAAGRRPDRADDLVDPGGLEQVRQRPGPERTEQVLVVGR